MKRFVVIVFLLSTVLLQNCSSKKAVVIDADKPSVLFTFEGIKPKFFYSLEAHIRKRFEKKGIRVGFQYNLKVPPVDNRDYENMPNYKYTESFDLTWNVNLTKIENRPYNPRKQETNSKYYFSLNIYKTETNELIDTSEARVLVTYRSMYNDGSPLAKKILRKYEKLFLKS